MKKIDEMEDIKEEVEKVEEIWMIKEEVHRHLWGPGGGATAGRADGARCTPPCLLAC